MRLPRPGLILLLLAGCAAPPPTPKAPSEAGFRALLARGNGSNVAVTSDSADDPRLTTRLMSTTIPEARAAILATVETMPRWTVVDSTGPVLWLTRTTRLFRFVDDLYVVVEARGEQSAVLVRSASRIGEGDLGQNRRNIAELWSALARGYTLRPLSVPFASQSH